MDDEDLIRQIESDAIDGSSDLSTVLRKCMRLAEQTGDQTLENWAKWEFNGYWKRGVPRYRVLHNVPSWGDLEGGPRPHGQLSFWHLPKQIRDEFQTLHVREGVGEISEKVAHGKESGIVRWPWPNEDYEIFNPEAYHPGCRLHNAWKVAQTSSVIAVPETIRHRVLEFVPRLKKAHPVVDEQTLQPTDINLSRSLHITSVSDASVAFLSYVRLDDHHEDGLITELCNRLSGEIRLQTGSEFIIFQDRKDIAWGQQWQERIDESLDAVTFLIPIVTPSFFKSEACRSELDRFLDREKQLKRNDLILPVYYVECPVLNKDAKRDADPLAQVIAARQRIDWRELRFEPLTSLKAKKMIAEMAKQVADALDRA